MFISTGAGGGGGNTGGTGGVGGEAGAGGRARLVPVQLTAGSSHTCVRMSDGSVRCWGGNGVGQLGNGSGQSMILVPTPVDALIDVAKVDAGSGHTCALQNDGTATCWGENVQGQLFDQGMVSSPVPVPVNNLPPAKDICAGQEHTCAIANTGQVYCWGSQVVNGSGNSTAVPTPVSGLTTAEQISCSGVHTCVILGTVQQDVG